MYISILDYKREIVSIDLIGKEVYNGRYKNKRCSQGFNQDH